MKNLWGYCNNGKFGVGCNGATVYVFGSEGNELARFRDVKTAYSAKFLPNTNTVLIKTTEGSLAIYSLDNMELVKKIVITRIGAQDEGFSFSPDGKFLYNIEKPRDSFRTQLTIYRTTDYEVVEVLFNKDEQMHLKDIEFDILTGRCYLLGYMRDTTGVFDYGFVGELVDRRIESTKRLEKWAYYYTRAYKDWESSGFTKKVLLSSVLSEASDIVPITLKEIILGEYKIPIWKRLRAEAPEEIILD